jgi:hypothetical protein
MAERGLRQPNRDADIVRFPEYRVVCDIDERSKSLVLTCRLFHGDDHILTMKNESVADREAQSFFLELNVGGKIIAWLKGNKYWRACWFAVRIVKTDNAHKHG